MCTCINFKTKDDYLARNMDLGYNFNEKVVITPRNYIFDLKNGSTFYTKYAIIGMATVVGNYPLYADACNEKGLAIVALNFPKTACFNSPSRDSLNLATYEIITYLLGVCKSIKEVRDIALNLNITNIPFDEKTSVADLHWMICDSNDCIVLEQTKDGLKVHDNDLGVLTNNPSFEYQYMNVNNYMNLTIKGATNRFSDNLNLKPYCIGMGAIGLPGDNSSESRFVKATFNKFNSFCDDDELSSITQIFHILDSVAVVKGTIEHDNSRDYKTTYSCCMNLIKGIYYYKTYNNNQISAIMLKKHVDKKELVIYDLINTQHIRYQT